MIRHFAPGCGPFGFAVRRTLSTRTASAFAPVSPWLSELRRRALWRTVAGFQRAIRNDGKVKAAHARVGSGAGGSMPAYESRPRQREHFAVYKGRDRRQSRDRRDIYACPN
jgi:hypothetical protein